MAPKLAAKQFHHPYEPYPIQDELMNAVYQCIENGQVGIFESPTGTGKSLSLLCSTLTWLREHKRAKFGSSEDPSDPSDPDWLREHAREARKRDILHERQHLEDVLTAIRLKEDRIRKSNHVHREKRRKVDSSKEKDELDDFMLDDYDSDGDDTSIKRNSIADNGLSSETQALMNQLGMLADGLHVPPEPAEEPDEIKVLFCSRTHSQLSQLVGELRRIKLPSSYPTDINTSAAPLYSIEQVKQLSLGSRKQLCINDKVMSLKSVTAINERCLELQGSKVPKEEKCPHMPNKENEVQALDFKHHALAKIRDIEELGSLGRKLDICPYYAGRPALRSSEIVTLPYPLLLQNSSRKALGMSLKDNVVIIDEAHNLMDAITGMYTVNISLAQLIQIREQLGVYLQRFRNRLKGKNRVYVTQVVKVVDALRKSLLTLDAQTDREAVIKPGSLLTEQGVDQINIYKLLEYLEQSKLARKIQGYIQASQSQTSSSAEQSTSMPALTQLAAFLAAITNPSEEGCFFHASGPTTDEKLLRYLLLDPAEHFREIVETARAVLLVGGTMSPMDDYRQHLFPYLPQDRLTTLSCGHIIPPASLFVRGLDKCIDNSSLDFTFASRSSPAMIQQLGETLLTLLRNVPDGVVIFFPSYQYLTHVLAAWDKASILQRLKDIKPAFVDTQKATDGMTTEMTLAAYSEAVLGSSSGKGAILFSVIGGKLSEGINFSDRLGRLVIVIGLPYPNPYAPEWKAKMQYLESKAETRNDPSSPYVKGAVSRDFADNVCMRAVNQAIGRAIRHKNDWAAILLLDKRFMLARLRAKLPAWIKNSMNLIAESESAQSVASIKAAMDGFYASMTP